MTAVIVFVVLCGLALFVVLERMRLSSFRSRHDHRGLWMAAVAEADRAGLDRLLTAICGAFMIPEKYRFRLRPSDRLQELYRQNMRGQVGDSLEFENLAMALEDLGMDPETILSGKDCTAGILVRSLGEQTGERRGYRS